ncbi:MAG: bifunctional aspartate kinase/homoserine dehydrogenase I [Bacteroidales bacterium]|nr:bifunctional aspartate kinase/homoserine dehydrogenase I [Bacteroidales bacterium]
MRVLKFGGSVLRHAHDIKNVKKIIEGYNEEIAVIISAFGTSTDILINLSEKASKKKDDYRKDLKDYISYIHEIINNLFNKNECQKVFDLINPHIIELEDNLNGIYLLNFLPLKIKDKVLGFGEYISALIISEFIPNSVFIDSKKIIKTDTNFSKARIDFNTSKKLIVKHIAALDKIPVIPGFIGSDAENNTTTVGRGGSDYSASVIAAAIKADELVIWTNVDGFMTADPKIVEKAIAVKNLSYAEAMELSHFGAKVIYTPTIQPAYNEKIKIRIRNAFDMKAEGTIISDYAGDDDHIIKGVSSIGEISLITIHGPGMVGVKGISGRLFSSLARNDVNVIFITQASSEYSISFAVSTDDTKNAIAAINEEFKAEISLKHEIITDIEKELAIIAVVGEKMRHTPGISGNVFQSLGKNGINVIGIAQGSSELNISIVIKKAELKKALNVIHESFFLSNYKEIHLFMIGTGIVGGALLKQLKLQQNKLVNNYRLRINLIGLADISKMLIRKNGIDFVSCIEELGKYGKAVNLKAFVNELISMNLRNSIFVDCTASKDVASQYEVLLSNFISVVAANKIACSSDLNLYLKLKKTALDHNARFMYETNVGAGLPIINTINNLINSGDEILKIEAVLSGTLNFVFNEISENVPLSKAIKLAQEKGFSEPDPRIDLSGIDVVRKILILSRESGYKLEQKDVEVKGFLPEECFEGSLNDFWINVKKQDAEFEKRRKQLEKQNKKWRFVASLNNGKASVELKEVDSTHPSYPLVGSNNIVLLTTTRYKEQPMIIRGYGAGADVTAAGVFGDIMQVANV